MAMIKLIDVRKTFNQGKPNEFTALRDVRLELEAHRMTVLLGPSGSGKTTLLSLIGCMSRPSEGRIFLRDREMTSLPERFLTDVRRKTFGFIFQHFNLIPGLTALENVMLPAFPSGEKVAGLKKRAGELLDLFDVGSKAGANVARVSGGEARRITIARALINDPEVVIADEPTAHLDSRLSQEFMDLMGRLKENRKTVLIASHDPLVFESRHVDRVVGIRDGRIEDGRP
jgi:putative ABC transport system ATP-binding protein